MTPFFTLSLLAAITAPEATSPTAAGPNKLIDYAGFVRLAQEVEPYRQQRRIDEKTFLRMAREKGTIVLDTRGAAAYERLHVGGAVHLNFSDITKERLARVVPTKETRVLIYCNNNFKNEPEAFPSKMPRAALNLPTFVTLYEYGYRELYELAPLIDARQSRLPLVSGKTPWPDEGGTSGARLRVGGGGKLAK